MDKILLHQDVQLQFNWQVFLQTKFKLFHQIRYWQLGIWGYLRWYHLSLHSFTLIWHNLKLFIFRKFQQILQTYFKYLKAARDYSAPLQVDVFIKSVLLVSLLFWVKTKIKIIFQFAKINVYIKINHRIQV